MTEKDMTKITETISEKRRFREFGLQYFRYFSEIRANYFVGY